MADLVGWGGDGGGFVCVGLGEDSRVVDYMWPHGWTQIPHI